MSKYFNGFCLKKEEVLFEEYRDKSEFCVSGFSFGAIKAVKDVYEREERVDKIQLFSPAFFQTQTKKFKRMQLMFFKKDPITYCDTFLKNIAYPSEVDVIHYFKMGKYEELDELLNFEWDVEILKALNDRGIEIEVYLGSLDKIVESEKAKEFFKDYATVYFVKEVGHILNK